MSTTEVGHPVRVVDLRAREERGQWIASASGATRAGYEAAINRVLLHFAQERPELKAIASDETFTELGLIARKRGPGRPRKATTAAE
ncbi:hypothetical protein [Streptomyces atratus]